VPARSVVSPWKIKGATAQAPFILPLERELELIQPQMAQKQVLRGEVGARVWSVCGQTRERRCGRAWVVQGARVSWRVL
jgi:hypothetical protein